MRKRKKKEPVFFISTHVPAHQTEFGTYWISVTLAVLLMLMLAMCAIAQTQQSLCAVFASGLVYLIWKDINDDVDPLGDIFIG